MEDCYFFYNSDCSKGSSCPFRHEPAALHSEIVCSFWLQGHCSKVPCSFRHSELIPPPSQRQSDTPCYWESKPGGCRKTSCPFLHSGMRPGQQPPFQTPPPPAPGLPQPKIIVNKNKIKEIGPILAQQMESERIVIPASRVPIKERLGSKMKKPCVKDRLGFKNAGEEDQDEEDERVEDGGQEIEGTMSEEQRLREKAIQSLDLRKRIPRASDEKEESESSEEPADVIVRSLVQKVKKDTSSSATTTTTKKKKSKKLKKRRRRRSVSEDEDSEGPRNHENESSENEGRVRRPSPCESRNLAARALRDLKSTTQRKRKGRRKAEDDDEEERKKTKRDSKELFETAAREMETINEAISESNDVLKELEDLINN